MNFIRTNKIYCHPERLKQYFAGKKPLPITVEIHPSNACSNRCSYCVFASRSNEIMKREDLLKCIERIAGMGVKGLIYSGGGEPLMNPAFAESLEFAYSQGLDIGIITNGTELRDKSIDLIAEMAVWIRFSLDSNNRTDYKKIRGVDFFDKVIRNIQKIVQHKREMDSDLTIGIQSLVLENNYRQIYGISKFAKKLGVDYFQYRPLENSNYKKDVISEIWVQQPLIETLSNANFTIIDTSYKWELLKEKKRLPCYGIDFIGAIDVHGDFYCCCHKIASKDKRFIYGNLLKDNTLNILNNREQVQSQLDIKECPVACRGSALNQTLHSLRRIKHKNFL